MAAKLFTPTFSAAGPPPAATRTERRMLKRGDFGQVPGNNRPNRPGRAVQQEEIGTWIQVGEEPRLVEVLTISRGKGGKKKYRTSKLLLSRKILAEMAAKCRREDGSIDEKKMSVLGLVVVDDETDSVKNAGLLVLTRSNGRVRKP